MIRPMRVCFITTCNKNIGDDFVREGIRSVLDGLCEYRSYFVNKHFPELTCATPLPEDEGPPLADKILDSDVVVQCGAPVYWNLGPSPGQKCCTAEWIVPLWYERIAKVCHGRPVLNLAAGACQGYFGSAEEVVRDEACARFIRDIHSFCRLTTVRDRMAEEIHFRLGLSVIRQPCASILAWRRRRLPPVERETIALNFMPPGGHYDLEGRVDTRAWAEKFLSIWSLLRAGGEEVALVAHDRAEVEALRTLLPGHPIFYSSDFRDYFSFYARCRGGIFNRVHGAFLLAGAGTPAVIVGNDSRSWMVDEVSLPRWHVSECDPVTLVTALLEMAGSQPLREHLVQLEEQMYQSLKVLCASAIEPRATAQDDTSHVCCILVHKPEEQNMNRDRDWLTAEIHRRAPWYQRIEFPEYGITTTDDPRWVVNDAACDNLFPGMNPADAPRLRPVPKYERLRPHLPDVSGRTVLDVGCSCGFFAFEFCRLGAKAVTGLDIDSTNVERATFSASVLGLQNARFVAGDVGQYAEAHDVVWGASLHEHFFFPFYYLARLLFLAKERLILETHHYIEDDEERVARLDLSYAIPGRLGTHAFHFSRKLFIDYLKMLGVAEESIEERVFYEDSRVRRLLLSVATAGFQRNRGSNPFLKPLESIG
jgi:SAM-dependent methyltransferase